MFPNTLNPVLTPPFSVIQSPWLSQGTLRSLWVPRGMLPISRVPVLVSRGNPCQFGEEPCLPHYVENRDDDWGNRQDAEEKPGPELYPPAYGEEEDPPHENRYPR